MSDPAKYRPKEEVDKVRTEHDPIEQVRSRLLKKGFASEDALKKIDAEVRAAINEAAEFATNDAEPDPGELWANVYAEEDMAAAVTKPVLACVARPMPAVALTRRAPRLA